MIKNLDDDLQQHSRIKVKVEKDNITDWRNFGYRRCVKKSKFTVTLKALQRAFAFTVKKRTINRYEIQKGLKPTSSLPNTKNPSLIGEGFLFVVRVLLLSLLR